MAFLPHGAGWGPIIVMGVAASGKSSVALALTKELGREFIEGDDWHPPANRAKLTAGIALDDDDRWPWLDAVAAEANARQDVVIACSALRRSYRDRLRSALRRPPRFIFLSVLPALLQQRLATRAGHFMAPSLLASQLATLEPPGKDEADALTVDGAASIDAIVATILCPIGRAQLGRSCP